MHVRIPIYSSYPETEWFQSFWYSLLQCWNESGLRLGLYGWVQVRVQVRDSLWLLLDSDSDPLASDSASDSVQWTQTHTCWTRTLAWWTHTQTRTLASWTRTHCWTHKSDSLQHWFVVSPYSLSKTFNSYLARSLAQDDKSCFNSGASLPPPFTVSKSVRTLLVKYCRSSSMKSSSRALKLSASIRDWRTWNVEFSDSVLEVSVMESLSDSSSSSSAKKIFCWNDI